MGFLLGSGIVIQQAQLGLVFDCHPNQGRRAWPLQSSWVVLQQDTLTCCHPDWAASGRKFSFLRVGGHVFADSR